MRTIVTGGCGFVGSAVARTLVDRGDQVLVIDSRLKSIQIPLFADLTGNERFVRLQADATDRSLLRSVFREFAPDRVFHLVAPRDADATEAFDAGITSTFAVMDAIASELARRDDAKRAAFRLVCAQKVETRTARADQKAAAAIRAASTVTRQALLDSFSVTLGVPHVTCVASEVFGPHGASPASIVKLITALQARESFELVETHAWRDWLPIRDFADGLIAAADRGQPGRTYQFSVGAERRDCDMADMICSLLDRRSPLSGRAWSDLVTIADARVGPTPIAVPLDGSQAEAELGWKPRGFHAGIERLIDWPDHPKTTGPSVQYAAE